MPRTLHLLILTPAFLAAAACSRANQAPVEGGLALPAAQATASAAAEVDTPEVTATASGGPRRLEPTVTTTPFSVPQDDIRSILDLAHPDHVDGFDHPNAWFSYDTPGRAAYWVSDGKLSGLDYEPDEIYVWETYTDTASGNVYAEVSATNGDCIEHDSLGMVIRVDRSAAAGGYSIEVSCDVAWRFRLHQIGADQIDLVEWTRSDAIHTGPGAVNRLGLWGYQARFRLYVNGEEVGEYWDTRYRHSYGTFALYTRASQTYDLTGTFDDFAYWNIEAIP
jgi:hypothetical protein